MCPTTVVPLHVATEKDHGDSVCHGNKPTVNKSTSDSMTHGAYN